MSEPLKSAEEIADEMRVFFEFDEPKIQKNKERLVLLLTDWQQDIRTDQRKKDSKFFIR